MKKVFLILAIILTTTLSVKSQIMGIPLPCTEDQCIYLMEQITDVQIYWTKCPDGWQKQIILICDSTAPIGVIWITSKRVKKRKDLLEVEYAAWRKPNEREGVERDIDLTKSPKLAAKMAVLLNQKKYKILNKRKGEKQF